MRALLARWRITTLMIAGIVLCGGYVLLIAWAMEKFGAGAFVVGILVLLIGTAIAVDVAVQRGRGK